MHRHAHMHNTCSTKYSSNCRHCHSAYVLKANELRTKPTHLQINCMLCRHWCPGASKQSYNLAVFSEILHLPPSHPSKHRYNQQKQKEGSRGGPGAGKSQHKRQTTAYALVHCSETWLLQLYRPPSLAQHGAWPCRACPSAHHMCTWVANQSSLAECICISATLQNGRNLK